MPDEVPAAQGRAPYGARGLKLFSAVLGLVGCSGSRPVWGAWIEIPPAHMGCHPGSGRAPYGARGLKLPGFCGCGTSDTSRPVWGAWIEICWDTSDWSSAGRSRPVWGAWIEIFITQTPPSGTARRAPYGARGLKCPLPGGHLQPCQVAPRMGRVD